ncbi:MAG: hypothetical protein DI536_36745, partial [Archangium gephyra]
MSTIERNTLALGSIFNKSDEASALTAASLPRHPYGADVSTLIRANIRRAMTLEFRNVVIIVRIAQILIMSFAVATLFILTPHKTIANGISIMGAIFFSALMMLIAGGAELQQTTQRLSVLYKQRDARYYPTWAYVLGSAIFRTPFSALDATAWTLIMYWAVGLDNS